MVDKKILEKVRTAILPMKEKAEEAAVSILKRRIAETLETLGRYYAWDRYKMQPYPNSLKMGRVEYMENLSKYRFLSEITTADKATRMMHEPDFCKADEKKIARALETARVLAGNTFEAYACKLAKKVGTDVVAADAVSEGNDLWQASTLQTYHADGTFTAWATKTIVNCSVYGKLFLQFPTRKRKG